MPRRVSQATVGLSMFTVIQPGFMTWAAGVEPFEPVGWADMGSSCGING